MYIILKGCTIVDNVYVVEDILNFGVDSGCLLTVGAQMQFQTGFYNAWPYSQALSTYRSAALDQRHYMCSLECDQGLFSFSP